MYYPEQTSIAKLTTIRRQVKLPEEAIGRVRITQGTPVDVRDVVANGAIPARHLILDAMEPLGLKKPEQLEDLMLVRSGRAVEEGQAIAGKNPERGRRLFSPIDGIFTRIHKGRVILQEVPQLIDLQAGLRGMVVAVQPGRGVTIEATGAEIQGIWGNDRSVIASLRLEPEDGIQAIRGQLQRFVGAAIVSRRSLTELDLAIAEDENVAGFIAPSMDAALRDRVMQSNVAVMLTDRFGTMRMGSQIYNLFAEFEGHQVSLDAHQPGRWDPRRPSAVINQRAQNVPPGTIIAQALKRGMRVRINRDPYIGYQGRVLDLPYGPVLLENGLRVPCAQVEVRGQAVNIPLANLEFAGG